MSQKNDDSKEQGTSDGLKLEGHSYDGIEELDNALPSWWINGFYLSIIFAIGYFIYYSLGEGPSLLNEYKHAKSDYEIAQFYQKNAVKVIGEDVLRAFLKDPARIKAGQGIFQSKCVACHGAQGQGGIGPNLTDDFWLHGGKMAEILNTITNGVLDKGMPPWGPVLSQEEIYSVLTFVKSLRGSHPANAKAPQGALVKE
jgi:cytochrome c oxidase cbb3-type subunit 3